MEYMEMSSAVAQVDTIEQSVVINAPIEKVWSFVSKTGWWAGPQVRFDLEANPGETIEREAGEYGFFPVRVETLDPPKYAAFRWASAYPKQVLTETNSTLVEFSLTTTDDGVLVAVKESGFASLEGDHPFIAEQFANNSEGWAMQLQALANEISAS
jgi:uncharacterized protein YndB with AHSA1/START domain